MRPGRWVRARRRAAEGAATTRSFQGAGAGDVLPVADDLCNGVARLALGGREGFLVGAVARGAGQLFDHGNIPDALGFGGANLRVAHEVLAALDRVGGNEITLVRTADSFHASHATPLRL